MLNRVKINDDTIIGTDKVYLCTNCSKEYYPPKGNSPGGAYAIPVYHEIVSFHPSRKVQGFTCKGRNFILGLKNKFIVDGSWKVFS